MDALPQKADASADYQPGHQPGRRDRSGAVDDGAQPGVLRGEASIVLHTRHGQQLYLGRQAGGIVGGRPVPPIPGVLRFASQVRQAAIGARAGDPYADWMLVRLDGELEEIARAYAGYKERVDGYLHSCPGITIQVALSVQPLAVPMKFGSPYAFKAAEIVASFDALACRILTAVHTARIARSDGERLLQDAKRHARRFLQTPGRYTFSGATREDLVRNTQRGAAAIARFGPLPDEILQRHVRPRFERIDAGAPAAAEEVDDLLDNDSDDATAPAVD